MIVANAAPVTPQPNIRIITGSSTIFTIVPSRFPTIDSLAAPSPLKILANAVENRIVGAPMEMISRYFLAKPMVFSLAPISLKITSIPSTEKIATITPSPSAP